MIVAVAQYKAAHLTTSKTLCEIAVEIFARDLPNRNLELQRQRKKRTTILLVGGPLPRIGFAIVKAVLIATIGGENN